MIDPTKPLRLLVVGAGRMGKLHIQAIASSKHAITSGVVEPSHSNWAEVASPEISHYADLTQAIAARGFDAAVVATPSGSHLKVVEALLTAEVPTLCEKPCGLTIADTLTAARIATDTATILQVGYWRRFVPELQDLRDSIAQGDLGEIVLAQAWQWDGEPPTASFRASSGGIMLDMGVHEVDQIRWLTGHELRVQSISRSLVTSAPAVEDDPESILAVGSLSGGGVAAISLGRRYDRGDCCWVEIIGTKSSHRSEFMNEASGERVFTDALVAQIDNFAETIQQTAEPRGAIASDAVAALQVVEASRSLHANSISEGETQ